MASSNNSNNPSGNYPGRSPFPGSESQSGTTRPVGSSPFGANSNFGSSFAVRPSGLLVPPSMGDGGGFQGGMPDFSSLMGGGNNTNPFSNGNGAIINPSPFNGGQGGSTVSTGAAGASGANTMEFQSIMRTLTTELQNFSRLLQNINRGGGGGGGGVGIAGGGMTAQQMAAQNRVRDPNTGRFAPSGINRTIVQGGASGAPAAAPSPTSGPTVPPVTAPSTATPLGPGGQPLPNNPDPNARELVTARAGRHHIFSGSPVPAGPGIVHSRSMSPSHQALMPGGVRYVQAPQEIIAGGDRAERGSVYAANRVAQNVNAAYLQQQQAELEAGTGSIGPQPVMGNQRLGNFMASRVGGFISGVFSRRTAGAIARRRAAAVNPQGVGTVDVPEVDDLASTGGVGSQNRGVAQGYNAAAAQRNAAVNQAGANASRGVAAGEFTRKRIADAMNITGTRMSELAAGIPYIGGALSSIFAAAEGAGEYAELEFPMAQAALATGRRVVTSTRGRKRRFNDLASYGIGGAMAQGMQTEFGLASGGRALGNISMGLIAQGLDASTAGRMMFGMGAMGGGFTTATQGVGMMGLASQLGIQGVGLQAQFAEAFSGMGGNILSSGVGITAGMLAKETGVIQRGKGSVANRLRGVDAMNMAAQGIMGNVQSSQNIGATVFGGSSLYDMLSFSNAFAQTGSLRGARRMMEGETATETNARLQGAFGQMATEFAMLGKFTEFQTTEYERRGGEGSVVSAGVRSRAANAAAATRGSTKFSGRRVRTESGNLSTMYANQDKIIAVMEENIALQRQLLDSVDLQDIKDISNAVMSINKVVVNSSAKIAGLLSQVVNGLGSIISWFGGGSAPPKTPAQTSQRRQQQLKGSRSSGQPRPPVSSTP